MTPFGSQIWSTLQALEDKYQRAADPEFILIRGLYDEARMNSGTTASGGAVTQGTVSYDRTLRRRQRHPQKPARMLPDQPKNQHLISIVLPRLAIFGDVTATALAALAEDEFDLKREFGIDPEPLFGHNTPENVASAYTSVFGVPLYRATSDWMALEAYRATISKNRLLGEQTDASLNFLRELFPGKSDLSTMRVADETSSTRGQDREALLTAYRQLIEKLRGRQTQRNEQLCVTIVNDLKRQVALMRIGRLFDDCVPRLSDAMFFRYFADHIAQIIVDGVQPDEGGGRELVRNLAALRGRGLEIRFVPRDRDFATLGMHYGDCTAPFPSQQVNQSTGVPTNVHWSVYAWLLDPYYRILELTYDGRRALKTHVLPLMIHGRKVLMIDAIEVVPTLRRTLRGRPNTGLDLGLYERRDDLLEAVFAECRRIGARMGVESIYIDKYSNCDWVREYLDRKLPADSYDVVYEAAKPFETYAIESNVRELSADYRDPATVEVQALDLTLMHQGMRYNHKEVAVLEGKRRNARLSIGTP